MDIISKIKQEFNYVVYDPKRLIKMYEMIQQNYRLVCLYINNDVCSLWQSSNGNNWGKLSQEDFLIKNMLFITDLIFLSMLFENVFIEFLDVSLLSQMCLPQKALNIKLFHEPFWFERVFLSGIRQLKCPCTIRLFIGGRGYTEANCLHIEIKELLLSLPFEVIFFCEF